VTPDQPHPASVLLALAVVALLTILLCDWIATIPTDPRWAEDDDTPDDP